MKTVAYIPIKLNNQRTPGKNIKHFSDGKPLMHFVQNAMLELKNKGLIDDVYVYCSSEDVVPYLLSGVKLLKRPEKLDRSDTKGREIYNSFFNTVKADVYVLAHATSPFVTIQHIEECVKNVQSGDFDSAFCAKKIQNFLWKNNQPLNFTLDNPLRTQDMEAIYMELSTPYVYSRETWERHQSRTGINPYICECNEIEAVDIDYPEDFELADAIYTNILKKGV